MYSRNTLASAQLASMFAAALCVVALFQLASSTPYLHHQLQQLHHQNSREAVASKPQSQERREELLNEIVRLLENRQDDAAANTKRHMSRFDDVNSFADDDPLLTLMVPPKKDKGSWLQ
jgi:hypothetical protein